MAAITWLDRWEHRVERRLQLERGRVARWRGIQAGKRLSLGRGVRILHPACLHVGDDVSIEDYGYLHCLSARGVHIGDHTSIGRNLWLHCGGKPDDYDHGYFEIGEHSFIGCNAALGAGGGIRIRVQSYTIVAGVPARVMGARGESA
jgi:acetyltransferase-like isoleucine patch superfamily enzyme